MRKQKKMMRWFGAIASAALIAAPSLASAKDDLYDDYSKKVFKRIATFPVFQNTDVELETVAEIVSASQDGKTLVYTDSETGNIGFVDITKPSKPIASGIVSVGGEPTSVAVAGRYALVAVNTSDDFINVSGKLVVIDIKTQTVVATHPLSGQPDSVAVSPNKRYAAIAIENERDEDLGNGEPPQAPAGFMVIVDLIGKPAAWTMREVDMTGVADVFPEDPEPEYIDINRWNIAAVSLQENNHIILVYLPTGEIINDFSAGVVDLDKIDISENDLIELNGLLTSVPREPDGLTWVSPWQFVTADEGDLFGGSRGFTQFNLWGDVDFSSGNSVEHLVVRHGHYPEARSENKGNEPENAEYGRFGNDRLLFVGSERSNAVIVYKLRHGKKPKLQQLLPTGVGPEGLLAIPHRNLLVVASEKDDRGDKFRSSISIYKRGKAKANYPTVVSANRKDGTPIPWSALSGLAIDGRYTYSIPDSFYQKSRIFQLDRSKKPAVITGEIVLKDALGKLAAIDSAMVNDDGTVNLDQEGIAVREDGGFWIASEGAGTVGDASRPFETFNLLLKVSGKGVIEQVVKLPDAVNARQVRFGFEGVTSVGYGADETVYVAFQRKWAGDPTDRVRIGQYKPASGEWHFFFYPLDTPTSPNGGWVGLSEIVALGKDKFAVIERDNQGGTDATIKRIYKFSTVGLTPGVEPGPDAAPDFPVVEKKLVKDLMPILQSTGGMVLEKIEGLAVTRNGTAYIVNDNDGVDDSNGETQLLKLKKLF